MVFIRVLILSLIFAFAYVEADVRKGSPKVKTGNSKSVQAKSGKVNKSSKFSAENGKSSIPTYGKKFNHRYIVPVYYDQRIDFKLIPSRAKTSIKLGGVPTAISFLRGVYYVKDSSDRTIVLTLDDRIQRILEKEAEIINAPHIALVVMDVNTGKILGYVGRSISIPNPINHNGFRAASLFKIVTAAAAFDFKLLRPDDRIFFRGSLYELSPANYFPNPQLDSRSMAADLGLAKSANPVFGRIALNFLNPTFLNFYSDRFGFNWKLNADFELKESRAFIPENDFDFARTAAGFGNVFVTPIHSAGLIAALANKGRLMRPSLIEAVVDSRGQIIYTFESAALSQVVSKSTASELLSSLALTQSEGTAKKAFAGSHVAHLVAGKTGTLSNDDPKGLLLSYVATFPLPDPKFALSVIVVGATDPASRASYVGRRIIEQIMLR